MSPPRGLIVAVARGALDGGLHQSGGDAHAGAVDPGAGAGERVDGRRVLHLDAGLLEHLERRLVHALAGGVVPDRQARLVHALTSSVAVVVASQRLYQTASPEPLRVDGRPAQAPGGRLDKSARHRPCFPAMNVTQCLRRRAVHAVRDLRGHVPARRRGAGLERADRLQRDGRRGALHALRGVPAGVPGPRPGLHRRGLVARAQRGRRVARLPGAVAAAVVRLGGGSGRCATWARRAAPPPRSSPAPSRPARPTP